MTPDPVTLSSKGRAEFSASPTHGSLCPAEFEERRSMGNSQVCASNPKCTT